MLHNRKHQISPKRVRELLDYDPATGVFTWRVNRGRKTCIGVRAGSMSHGYRRIKIDDVLYDCAYLAWLHFYGEEPAGVVDHKDLNKSHDAIQNLRVGTRCQNFFNQRARSTNNSGFKGVKWEKSRNCWKAQITANGKRYHMGSFEDPEIAAAAYRIGAAVFHGEFARAA